MGEHPSGDAKREFTYEKPPDDMGPTKTHSAQRTPVNNKSGPVLKTKCHPKGTPRPSAPPPSGSQSVEGLPPKRTGENSGTIRTRKATRTFPQPRGQGPQRNHGGNEANDKKRPRKQSGKFGGFIVGGHARDEQNFPPKSTTVAEEKQITNPALGLERRAQTHSVQKQTKKKNGEATVVRPNEQVGTQLSRAITRGGFVLTAQHPSSPKHH